MLESFFQKLSNLVPVDKLVHFFYGTLTFIFLVYILSVFVTLKIALLISLTLTSLLTFSKEIYDSFKVNHTSDVYDFIFTVLTGVLITLAYFIKD